MGCLGYELVGFSHPWKNVNCTMDSTIPEMVGICSEYDNVVRGMLIFDFKERWSLDSVFNAIGSYLWIGIITSEEDFLNNLPSVNELSLENCLMIDYHRLKLLVN